MIMFLTSADYHLSTISLNVVNNATNEETHIADISKEWFDKLSADDKQTFLVVVRLTEQLSTEQKNEIVYRMGIVPHAVAV
jgi:hypothetical protein